jgi:hypothetical protein
MTIVRLLGKWQGSTRPGPTPASSARRSNAPTAMFATNDRERSAGLLLAAKIMLAGTFSTDDGDGTWVARLNPTDARSTDLRRKRFCRGEFRRPEHRREQFFAITTNQPVSVLPDGSMLGFMSGIIEDNEGGSSREFNFKVAADGRQIDMIQLVPPPSFVDWGVLAQPDGKLITFGDTGLVRVNDAAGGGARIRRGTTNRRRAGPVRAGASRAGRLGDHLRPGRGGGGSDEGLHPPAVSRRCARSRRFDAREVTMPRTSAVRFSVTWRDDDGIDSTTFDSLDIRVRGPFDGETRWHSVTLESVTPLSDGRFRAIYKLTSPGGWTAADNGDYRVRLDRGQVQDDNGIFASAGTVGTLRVRIA